jgi:Tol biopolymer transport system component
MKAICRMATAAVLLLVSCTSDQSTGAQTRPYKLEETRLGPWKPPPQEASESVPQQIPPRREGTSWVISDDELHIASVGREGGKFRVFIDGVPGPDYDAVRFMNFARGGNIPAYAARKGGKWFVVLDGKETPAYGEPQPLFLISPDGKRAAYIAKDGEKTYMVVDGKPFGQYDPGAGPALFSPDSAHFAYSAWNGKKVFVVLDGKQGQEYGASEAWDTPMIDDLTFSPDGNRLAYTVSHSTRTKCFVVLDGTAGPGYGYISYLAFSPDSKHLAYCTGSAGSDKKCFAVLDGKPGPEFDGAADPVFSPDGEHFAYKATKGGKSFIVLDGQPGPEYDHVNYIFFTSDGAYDMSRRDDVKGGFKYAMEDKPCFPLFSPDGKTAAYWGTNGENDPESANRFAVVNGQPRRASLLSPDGKRSAFVDHKDGKYFVVVDGRPSPAYDDENANPFPAFSPDSGHFAYMIWKGNKAIMVIDGQEGPEFDRIEYTRPLFSPDGQRSVYAASNGKKEYLVFGGSRIVRIDGFPWCMLFSADSKHIAYELQGSRDWVVVDGQPGPKYGAIFTSPRFRPDGALEYVAEKDHWFYRVKQLPSH